MKKRKVVIIAFIAVLFLLSGIVSVAKYVKSHSKLNVAAPARIYMSSDQMTKDGKEISYVWDGVSLSIPVTLYPYDGLHNSTRDVNLEYDIDYDTSVIRAEISGQKTQLKGGKERSGNEFYINVSPVTDRVTEDEGIIPLTVIVKERTYNQQLSATWNLKVQESDPEYKISDQGAYLSCDIQIPVGSNDEQNICFRWNHDKFIIDSTNPLVYKKKEMETGEINLALKTGASYQLNFFKKDIDAVYSEVQGKLKWLDEKYVMEVNPVK